MTDPAVLTLASFLISLTMAGLIFLIATHGLKIDSIITPKLIRKELWYYAGSFGAGVILTSTITSHPFGLSVSANSAHALNILISVTEEVVFRAFLIHYLSRGLSPNKAIVGSSALWTVFHIGVYATAAYLFPLVFLVGIVYGWADWKTKHLLPSMFSHITNNFLVP